MDLDDALAAASPLERRLYALTLTDGGGSLAQAVEWYEEMAESSAGDIFVDVRLAILRAEAGRLADVQETVGDWQARGEARAAEVIGAAYLAAPLEPGWPARQAVDRLVDAGWFHDRLAVRLAPRIADDAWLAETREAAHGRTRPLLRLIRTFAVIEVLLLALGVAAALSILIARRRTGRG